jgi:DNA replication and repair protein RecF
LHGIYLYNLSNYNKIVNQRNRILKDISFHPEYAEMLDVWDEQMASYGAKIIRDRDTFVELLNGMVKNTHRMLSGNLEELQISYEKSVEADDFADALKRNRERDMKFKMTMLGPHRDDLNFKIKGVDIRKYGSQGQQRTAALALKLAEIELVKREIKDTPVLLLDDVLSELDSSRQHYLLESIHDIQTLITCTGLDDFIENQFKINKVFHVVEGTVE